MAGRATAHPDLLPTWVANRGHRRWVFIALYDGHEFCGEYKGTVHRSPRMDLLERTQRHGLEMVARIGSGPPKRCHSRLTCRTCGGTCPRSRRKSGSRQREPECCSAWSHCPCTGTRGQACILKAIQHHCMHRTCGKHATTNLQNLMVNVCGTRNIYKSTLLLAATSQYRLIVILPRRPSHPTCKQRLLDRTPSSGQAPAR